MSTYLQNQTVASGASVLTMMAHNEDIWISDIIGWKRFVYDFETYRFLGMSRKYLLRHSLKGSQSAS